MKTNLKKSSLYIMYIMNNGHLRWEEWGGGYETSFILNFVFIFDFRYTIFKDHITLGDCILFI